jgi:glycosyltransferase involved in cell wall biosynthesis
MYSLIIPVYRNEGSIPALLDALTQLQADLGQTLEVVFVVDGSPDRSYALLHERLPAMSFPSRLLLLSRNFGSFAAIRCGLEAARGPYFAVMAADLQEPPELAAEFFRLLKTNTVDVVIGTRDARADPLASRLGSGTFWWLYRKLINPEIPPGGVDVFGCDQNFRDHLLQLDEHHSSLIALLFWLGFRRGTVKYARRVRTHGKSAWTLRRKLKYMLDSVFAFSDLPIRLLLVIGMGGIAVALLFGAVVLISRLTGEVDIPGYAATIITILFFGGLNALGLGIIGAYVWRAFANTQRRPLSIVMQSKEFAGNAPAIKEPTP